MTREHFAEIWNLARKRHCPTSLLERWWWRINPNPSVELFVTTARAALQSPQLDNPQTAAIYVGWFMEALLQPFQRLVETGKLDNVLPRLPALPVLYSPNAGAGAGDWKAARELYDRKHVGSESLRPFIEANAKVGRNPLWRHLAYDAIWVIQYAILNLPHLVFLRGQSVSSFSFSWKISKNARKAVEGAVYLLPESELVLWPSWLDSCAKIPKHEVTGLPLRLHQARQSYLEAAREVLDTFFAQADEPSVEEIVKSVRGVRHELYRATIVAEARKNVLDVIKRMR